MSTKIEADEIKVGRLFSDQFLFSLPIYQRPFSWAEENFENFFEDISNAIEDGLEEYFIGSILLQQKDGNSYYVVDGQQRITTIAILFAVIRDGSEKEGLRESLQSYIYQKGDPYKKIPDVVRIEPWEDMKSSFYDYIYKQDKTKQFLTDIEEKAVKYKDQKDPKYHLYEAIKTFYGKLEAKAKKYDDQAAMEKFVDNFVTYLNNNVSLVCIKTGSQTSAFRLFSVLNSRGLPLGVSDLLKSENLEAIDDEAKRKEYAEIWRDIEEEIGREELQNVIGFIRTIKKKEKARKGMYDEFQEIFQENKITKGIPFIDYLKSIENLYRVKVLEPSVNLEGAPKNEYKNSVDLMRRFIPFSDWIPPLLAFRYKFDSDDGLLRFLTRLEKKTVLEWATRYTPTERITSLNKIIEVVDTTSNPQEVIDGIEVPRREDIESRLNEILNDPNLYSTYGGRLARYILLRIDVEDWELENFTGYPGTLTVEHILPQNPGPSSEWARIFNDEEKEGWTNKLGNLVLLSGRKNSKARNYDFQEKKDVYFKGKATAFRITRALEPIPNWDLKALKNRHREMTNKFREIFLS